MFSEKAGIGFVFMSSTWAGKLVYDAQAFHDCFDNTSSNFDDLNVSLCHLTLPEPTHQQKGENKFCFLDRIPCFI